MRQKLYTMFFCVFSLAFVATDCKHNPVGPEIIQPGRRDYTWTFDTLHLQQGYLETIWGSSPTDIWAGGYDDLFHYDVQNGLAGMETPDGLKEQYLDLVKMMYG